MVERRWPTALIAAVLALAACQAATGSPSASPGPAMPTGHATPGGSGAPATSAPPGGLPGPSDGPEKLVVDLEAAGASARIGEVYAGDPFDAQGGLICAGAEPVQVYVFGSVRAREEAARRIDPTNPSDTGTAMVDWNGRPRLWERDRMIIVYLGEDAATEALLRGVLGEPFASGQGRPALPGPKTCG